MPKKPLKPCSKLGCSELTRERFCFKHQSEEAEIKKRNNKNYDENVRYKKDKRYAEFYQSMDWKRIKKQALVRDHGLCQRCLDNKKIVTADVVHHKVPIKSDWSRRLDINNLVCWCHKCHNAFDH
jgi:5-methylcytosine-specific restriction protein A